MSQPEIQYKITPSYYQLPQDDNTYLREEKPFLWRQRGFERISCQKEAYVVIDGIEFKASGFSDVCVPFNHDEIDYDAGVIPALQHDIRQPKIKKCRVEIIPHVAVDIEYTHESWERYQRLDMSDYQYCFPHSTNDYVCRVQSVAEWYGIKVFTRNHDLFHDETPKNSIDSIEFYYRDYRYGYCNHLYIAFNVRQLLDCDFRIFNKERVADFKKFCEKTKPIKNCLNFVIFERPLSDIEKLDCATKFLKQFSSNKL